MDSYILLLRCSVVKGLNAKKVWDLKYTDYIGNFPNSAVWPRSLERGRIGCNHLCTIIMHSVSEICDKRYSREAGPVPESFM
jgi:hypothetical protein